MKIVFGNAVSFVANKKVSIPRFSYPAGALVYRAFTVSPCCQTGTIAPEISLPGIAFSG